MCGISFICKVIFGKRFLQNIQTSLFKEPFRAYFENRSGCLEAFLFDRSTSISLCKYGRSKYIFYLGDVFF